ncbi:hypothetical protein TEA_002966 [Camellia sinensis var. sinensis]|uniref:Ribosomal protein L1 n=1 Tax=Camellia sinensis var. sinensis TaxID=542762 RepID=A0A4S4DAJ9_CAMSN|nr:hypothetical protein TEA_002966 [Camellia sinensis var. sinensis]
MKNLMRPAQTKDQIKPIRLYKRCWLLDGSVAGCSPHGDDLRVSTETVQKAVKALLKWRTSQSKTQKPQLFDQDDDFIYLILSLKKIPPKSRTNAYKIPLPHSLRSNSVSSEFCLIIDDRPKNSSKLTSESAKKKINSEDIPITKVLKLSKLKSDYKPFEAKRKLCDSFEMFFADRRIIPLLPKLLGKQFFKRKKIPVPVDLSHMNWKEQIEKACSSALLYLRTGTCSVVRIGKASMESGEIVENVIAAIDGVVEVSPKKWAGVRSFHLKFSDSVALPIYQTLPDMKLKIEGKKEFDEGVRKEFDEGVRKEFDEGVRKEFDEGVRKEFDEGVRKEFDEGVRKEFDEGVRKEFDEGVRKEFDEGVRKEFDEGVRKEFDEGVRKEFDEGVRKEFDEGVRKEFDEGVRKEFDEGVRKEFDEGVRKEFDEGVRKEFDEGVRKEFDEGVRKEFDEGVRKEFDEGVRKEFDEGVRKEFDEGVRKEFDEGVRKEFDEGVRKEFDEGVRKEFDEGVRKEFDEGVRKEFDEGVRKEFDEGVRKEFDEGVRKEFDEGVRKEFDEGVRKEFDEGVRKEFDEGVRKEFDEGVRKEFDEGVRKEFDEGVKEESKEDEKLGKKKGGLKKKGRIHEVRYMDSELEGALGNEDDEEYIGSEKSENDGEGGDELGGKKRKKGDALNGGMVSTKLNGEKRSKKSATKVERAEESVQKKVKKGGVGKLKDGARKVKDKKNPHLVVLTAVIVLGGTFAGGTRDRDENSVSPVDKFGWNPFIGLSGF